MIPTLTEMIIPLYGMSSFRKRCDEEDRKRHYETQRNFRDITRRFSDSECIKDEELEREYKGYSSLVTSNLFYFGLTAASNLLVAYGIYLVANEISKRL